MGYETMRDAIKTTLEGVTGIGTAVHDYRVHSVTWKEIFERHKDTATGKLLNWEVTREAENLALEAVGNAESTEPFYRRTHGWSILGVQALAEGDGPARRKKTSPDPDPTEYDFQILIEAVVKALRLNNFLDSTTLLPIIPQVPIISHQMFGGTFCHTCQIVFGATERVGG